MILLRIFKNSRSTGIMAVVLAALALVIPELIQPGEPVGHQGMPLFQMIFGEVHRIPFLDTLIATLLYILLAYLLVRIGVRFMLLEERSLMPALFLVLVAMCVPGALHVSPQLVASVFYLFSFTVLFDIAEKPAPFGVFNASLFMSLGGLFDLRLLWILPLLWIAIISLRGFRWREIAHTLVAPAIVLLFLFTWYWGILDRPGDLQQILSKNIGFPAWALDWPLSFYLYSGFLLLLLLIASVHMITRFQSRKTMVQDIYQVLFYMFVGGSIYFVLILHMQPTGLVYLAFPLSFVLSNFFHRKRNHWSHELAMWLLLGALGYLQFTI